MFDVNVIDEARFRSALFSNATGHGFEWRVVRGVDRVISLSVGDVRRVLSLHLGDNDDTVLVYPDTAAGLEAANRLRDRMNAAALPQAQG